MSFHLLCAFQGTVVAVKKIDESKFNINRKLLIDLKTVSFMFLYEDSNISKLLFRLKPV